ncbi:hypothetical protein [Janthinobacterium sp. PSPC3-1]|uniref:hypothetical protein n=1 Tax=Janthinobacterium sp. PSPC3-1 TaxID=2804653 RepID=UPI003CF57B42
MANPFDAALAQLKKIAPTLSQQKAASQHDNVETAKPSCGKRRANERLPTDQARSAQCKKGNFQNGCG